MQQKIKKKPSLLSLSLTCDCNSYRRGIIYEVWRWKMVTGSFSLKISKWDRKKLQDTWQGDVSSYKKIKKLEISVKRCKIQVWGLNRLQEFGILYKSAKVEQKTRSLGTLSVKIQL